VFFKKLMVSRFGLSVVAPFLFRDPKFLPPVFAPLSTQQVKAILFEGYLKKIAQK
jgi:hypothetical protein